MKNRILFVDDEVNILQAYSRTLRKKFDITTVTSGAAGLEVAANDGPFAVVVSDMRMPEMDGVEFLSKIRVQAPDTVRIMLTGNADQQTAIDAVNKGDIFRFLNKPCPPDTMADSLNRAIEQHRLINAEREMLENTLKGSLAALSEVLSLSKPKVFGRTTQYRQQILDCAKILGLETDWQLETIAMLGLVGTVSLPDPLVEKAMSGHILTEEEAEQFDKHPSLGGELIAKIPRLEPVADAIRYQHKNFDGTGFPNDSVEGEAIPIGARLLRVIVEFDRLEHAGLDKNAAIGKLTNESSLFDPQIVSALAQVSLANDEPNVIEVSINQLNDKMVLASSVNTKDGALLVCKGQRLTASVSNRLLNFWSNGAIDEKLLVIMKDDE